MDRKDLKAKPYHVKVKNNGDIVKIIHPSDVDVGTESFEADLRVFGNGTFAGDTTTDGAATVERLVSSHVTTSYMTASTIVCSQLTATSASFSYVQDQHGNIMLTSGRPDSFSGLAMWLEATASSVALDTTAPTSVQNWYDMSGNGRHLSQGTKARQPRWNTSNVFLSGTQLPSLEFQAGQLMSSSAFSVSTFTMIVGVQNKTNATLIMEHGPNLNTSDGHWLYTGNASGGASFNVRRGGVFCSRDMTTEDWASRNFYPQIIVVTHAGTTGTLQIYMNGVNMRESTVVAANNLGSTSTSQALYLGARSDLTVPMSGSIFAFALYTPAIPPFQALKVARYFANKYGVAML
jgi:hypothetical protein